MLVGTILRFLKGAFSPSFQAFWAKRKLREKVLPVVRREEAYGFVTIVPI